MTNYYPLVSSSSKDIMIFRTQVKKYIRRYRIPLVVSLTSEKHYPIIFYFTKNFNDHETRMINEFRSLFSIPSKAIRDWNILI